MSCSSKEELFGGATCRIAPPGLISSVGASAGWEHFVGEHWCKKGTWRGRFILGIGGAQEVIDALKCFFHGGYCMEVGHN